MTKTLDKATYEEVVELAKMLAAIQTLPTVERIAVQYYLKGILDNSMATAQSTAS